ncbi:ExeM/NucH family extracellular endonuclease [Pelomonas sp. SE-A7]|uniref:ExeM/NucH family extracellular endonuclease n=1 Tax=Pelomonas sp. SE-A7 TaxID=3054953 RepID=UPI00259CA75A|nr:ExeM/NucH family extracellular endonuclease [Pelomonas sp. SE-A7]MDM4766278.1 ExeM/NucH family extracellular endonuclease [Pelomonas sp. SE-A7]
MKLKTLVSLIAAGLAAPVFAAGSNVVISQVYGAGGNGGATLNADYVELFNRSNANVTIGGWSVQYASSAGTTWTNKVNIPAGVVLLPGQYYLIGMATGANGAALPTVDLTGTIAMAANSGKVALVTSTTAMNDATRVGLLDMVAYGASTGGSEGAPTAQIGTTTAALRQQGGCKDTDVNASDFDVLAPTPRNAASAKNVCAGSPPVNQPIVAACPDGVATRGTAALFTPTATDPDGIVNSVAQEGNWPAGFSLGSFTAAAGTGGTASQQVSMSNAVGLGTYTLGLRWNNADNLPVSCSFKVSVSGEATIPEIQGSGQFSPLKDMTVTTRGIVTKIISNGFYLQDRLGDNDPTTSDGIFVFTSVAPASLLPTIAAGQDLKLTAKVAEYAAAPSNPYSSSRPLTELTAPAGFQTLGEGYQIQPVEIDLLNQPEGGLERYEGMLVTVRGPLTVTQNAYLGSYGLLSLAAGGRTLNPTNVHRWDDQAAKDLLADNLARTILLDDGSSATNPNPTPYLAADKTVRSGDTTGDITGVLDFGLASTSDGFAMYKIHPLTAPEFERSNPRSETPPAVGGNLRVASANVLNFFTTFTNGQTADGLTGQTCQVACRGANNLTEFQRQRSKIVKALAAMNADVVGLMEIQNNGNTAVLNLVGALNDVLGQGTYAAVPSPSVGTTGTDAIRVAMIYKPGKLTLQGRSIADTAGIHNRPPFAQGFQALNGERFAVMVNHMKSKGGSCPSTGGDADDGLQGCFNATRVQQALATKAFVSTVQSEAGTPNVILIGDFNSYAKEQPIITMTSDGGIVDQVDLFDAKDYSYVFDGFAGRLDHGLSTPSLTGKIVGATSWHINADEPEVIDYNLDGKSVDNFVDNMFRASDHDPLLLGLNLVKTLTGTSGRDTIVGTAGDDVIEGGMGADTLTGNGGRNQFVYNNLLEGGDTITDFKPGTDLLVFTKLLQSAGVVSADPLASGHVTCTDSSAGAVIGVDTDAAGPLKTRPMVSLKAVTCANVKANSFKF